jgi:7-cyano-7-deazaguanine synthase
MDSKGAVVLFSGGLDSTVLAYHARAVWGDPIHLLSFEYGQRHMYELDVARKLAHDFVPESHRIVSVGPKGVGMRSALLGSKGDVTENASVVPCRNLWFLIAGAMHADALKLTRVAIGANLDDAETYLDCRAETIKAQERACKFALGWTGEFLAPFVSWPKRKIVERGRELGIHRQMHGSWSCYQPVMTGKNWGDFAPCMKCPACLKREIALAPIEPPHCADPASCGACNR